MGTIIAAKLASPLLSENYSQLITRFDRDFGISWAYMNPKTIPYFNEELLEDLCCYHETIDKYKGKIYSGAEVAKIQYLVLASKIPGVFNLGGNLSLFSQLIKNRNKPMLMKYATLCINAMALRIRHCNLPITTISLIQGEALGGGFEAALTSDIIIAEQSSRMGFPEILFNLFPGMGAYSFLVRKVGTRIAEDMIMSGKIYTADELYRMGLVNIIAEDGTGEDAVKEYIKDHANLSIGHKSVQLARNRINPVPYQELMDITSIWVDATQNLNNRDLRVIDRLVHHQKKLYGCLLSDNERQTNSTTTC